MTLDGDSRNQSGMGYQRSQIIVSLWTAFAPRLATPDMRLKSVPKIFARRVRNLLDRGVGITDDRRAGQKGVFQEYEVADAAELGIGLSLLNAGLPQAEVVGFLRAFQEQIRAHIDSVPTSSVNAEFPHFLIVKPLALNETLRLFGPKPTLKSENLSFFEPIFASSRETLLSVVNDIGKDVNQVILVEIGDLVSSLHNTLPDSVGTHRGRQ